MTQGTITTTVTWQDLTHHYKDELDDLQEAYQDTVDLIRDEYGENSLDRPLPQDPDSEDLQSLSGLRMTAKLIEESGKQIQSRNHALQQLSEEYDGNRFKLKMLSGSELMEIETELKMKARERGVEQDTLQHLRRGLVVDAAVVDAPDGLPTDDGGSPVPSDAPNPLTLALYEQVEDLNQSGAVGFRAPGFDDSRVSPNPAQSATPSGSKASSNTSPQSGSDTPDSGDSQ